MILPRYYNKNMQVFMLTFFFNSIKYGMVNFEIFSIVTASLIFWVAINNLVALMFLLPAATQIGGKCFGGSTNIVVWFTITTLKLIIYDPFKITI